MERSKTKAEWLASSDILPPGLSGYETDTGNYKRGDGVSTYANLSYTQVESESEFVEDADVPEAVAEVLAGPHNGVEAEYNSETGKITLTVEVQTGFTAEQAQDAVAALFGGGSHDGVVFVYNDEGDRIDATVSQLILDGGTP